MTREEAFKAGARAYMDTTNGMPKGSTEHLHVRRLREEALERAWLDYDGANTQKTWPQDVHAFHAAGEVPGRTSPGFPADDRIALRKKLIKEEASELLLAIDERDLVEFADGCIDLIVVTIGSMLEFGMDPIPLWNEVQRSNMAKFPVCVVCNRRGSNCPACGGRGTQLLLRDDGKILKPDGWTKPDIQRVLAFQTYSAEQRRLDAGANLD